MSSEFIDEHIEVARALARDADAAAAKAQKALEATTRNRDLARKLVESVERRWPAHLVALYRSNKEFIRALAERDDRTRQALEGLQRAATAQLGEQRAQFPSALEKAAVERSLPIDKSSRHPKYTFADGFFTLDVDEGKSEARLSDYESELARLPADVGAVLDTVSAEYKRVFGRSFEAATFLKKLRRHYQAILNKKAAVDGDPVPIRTITQRLGKNEKGFRTDEFAADLSRLVQGGRLEVDGRTLDLQQTKDSNQGMLLPGLAARGLVGFLVFRGGERV